MQDNSKQELINIPEDTTEINLDVLLFYMVVIIFLITHFISSE